MQSLKVHSLQGKLDSNFANESGHNVGKLNVLIPIKQIQIRHAVV